eukprot:TRINITY_DN7899_c0_g1_i1.p1 TRINITY_DN7899_c0_g1~~TRINITY_DN7899_c0_g1_i1.p1  ORF type:complete len:377 (+),score=97.96 TRINITY_DN7899_c0_g1_i1:68-1198(+)
MAEQKTESIMSRRMHDPAYYGDYLGVPTLTSLQNTRSLQYGGKEAHDEMLFIIIHQTYELWFKQILYELDSVRETMALPSVPEDQIGTAVHRLGRVTEIQRVLIEQIRILETMQPLDFLDFRDYLFPASGFQSMQFRLLEIRLGLQSEHRYQYQQSNYLSKFNEEDKSILIKAEGEATLFQLIEKWLERIPFLNMDGFSFWDDYRKAVHQMIEDDRQTIMQNHILTEADREKQLKELQGTLEGFDSLFDAEKYEEVRSKGLRRLSFKATQAAILIHLFQDRPILQLPQKLLTLLVDVDENLTTWRYRHTVMVHRMIGTKIGTGGSSGYHYLRSTLADRYKVFLDLFNISTYLLPRQYIPKLPPSVAQKLSFNYTDS